MHDLGRGRDLDRHGDAVDQLDPLAAQQAGELVLGHGVGNGRDRGQGDAGVGAEHGRAGQGVLAALAPAAVVLGAAAMLEPAHQRAVAAQHLHAVDAEVELVLARVGRALGHHQRPGDQRCGLAGPAGLDRQPAEIDVGALEHDLLAGRAADELGLHRQGHLDQRQELQRLAEAFGRHGLLEEGQGLAELLELVRLAVHAPGHPLDRAEQVGEHGHREALDVLEQHGGALVGEQPGVDLGDLEHRRDRLANTHQGAAGLEMGHELAQGIEGHEASGREIVD